MVEKFTILCIGNSHTAGYPDHDPFMGGDPASSYQFWLNKGLVKEWPEGDFKLINEGVCGDTSRGITTRLIRALQTMTCNLVILAGGTNDIGMIREDAISENLEKGYDVCREKNAKLIVTTVPPISLPGYDAPVTMLNHAIRAYSDKHSDVFIADWYRALQDDAGSLSKRYDAGDGVHLSRKGYERIGSLMVPIVGEVLSKALL
jgi:lysophospholipase L1-like esterase